MWIFLGIVAFIALLITIILLLPVYIILKSDENGEVYLRYKFLFKTFGEDPNPDNPILKTLKEASGISRLEKQNLKSDVKKEGFYETLGQSCRLLMGLLKEIAALLKHCTAKKFVFRVICAEETAADTAISYGQCCAVVYPISAFLSSVMKVKRKGQHIDVSCDYNSGKGSFSYDFLISVKVCHVLAAFFRIAIKEAKRNAEKQIEEQNQQQKPPSDAKKS